MDDGADTGAKLAPATKGIFAYTALRIVGVFALILAIAVLIYAIPAMFNQEELGAGTISIGFLLVTPTCIGAIASLLSDASGTRSRLYHILKLPLLVAVIVTVAALLILREGVICVVMLLPLWLPAMGVGGYIVHRLHKRFHRRNNISSTFLVGIAAFATLAGPVPFSTAQDYRFERAVIIAASPEEIWPLLESIPDIGKGEGNWNITQNLLAVPRPVSAQLEGRGEGAVRHARWSEGIVFEEHVTRHEPGKEIAWDFVFPDPTLHAHVDRHIDPYGPHLKVQRGGYLLEQLAEGRTRVTLYTEITLDTQLNAYPALWAHLMLGDIQGNILEIIRSRAE